MPPIPSSLTLYLPKLLVNGLRAISYFCPKCDARIGDAGPIATEFSAGRDGVPSALGDPKPRRSERAARALRVRAIALLDARCKLTELAAIFLTLPDGRREAASNALEQPFVGELMVN